MLLNPSHSSFNDWVPSKSKAQDIAIAALPTRLVYSLLKGAAQVAARSKMPMGELVELVQLAYFEELRKEHPRELSQIAERLGLSLRSVGSLNRRLKEGFFAAELQVQPTRQVCTALAEGSLSLAELQKALPELERSQVRQALDFLKKSAWVEIHDRKYRLQGRLRSYVDRQLTRRIDGLNRQMDIMAASVWARFVDNSDTAVGRTWVFSARPSEIKAFMEDSVKSLRRGAIDLEESAEECDDHERYGITFSVTGMK